MDITQFAIWTFNKLMDIQSISSLGILLINLLRMFKIKIRIFLINIKL